MRVRAPATTANLGPGFDCFGLALDGLYDYVSLERSDVVELEVTGRGAEFIPTDPERNTAGAVALEMLGGEGVSMKIEKGIRPSSGLGSSAASAAAAAFGINELFGLEYSREELVRFAAAGEAVVSGAPHADNVAPALMGGFTINRGDEVLGFEVPDMDLAAALPEIKLSTRDARSVLPYTAELEDVVSNVASASMVVAGVVSGDPVLMGRGMRDVVVEPRRSGLIRGYDEVRASAMDAGALGFAISGAGPTLLSVCRPGEGEKVCDAMVDAFGECGVSAEGIVSRPGSGAEVVE